MTDSDPNAQYTFILKTVQSSAFRCLIEALKEILTETNIEIDEDLQVGLAFTTFHFPELVDINQLTSDAWDSKSGTAEFKAAAIRIENLLKICFQSKSIKPRKTTTLQASFVVRFGQPHRTVVVAWLLW